MKTALIVSAIFPPANNIAAVRIGKFARYLPDHGWEPLVLTVDEAKGWQQSLSLPIDETRVFRVPDGPAVTWSDVNSRQMRCDKPILALPYVIVHRFYTLSVLSAMFWDSQGWLGPAVSKGLEIRGNHKVDVIFSSYGPASSHLVAARLCGLTGIPWVAEFRDKWASFPGPRRLPGMKFLEQKAERHIMRRSSYLVGVTEPMAEELAEVHGKKTSVIYNGYDPADYMEAPPLTDKFTISYTGRVYAGRRDPTPLFEAARELRDEGKITPKDFEIRFFGPNLDNTVAPLVEQCGVRGLVKLCGMIPSADSISRQQDSTVLLMLKWRDPHEQGLYSGKLFEYFGAGRPILAVGAYQDPLLDGLLSESGTGVSAHSPAEVKAVLLRWLEEWRQQRTILSHFAPKQEVIHRYTRQAQTQRLAEIFEEVSSADGISSCLSGVRLPS